MSSHVKFIIIRIFEIVYDNAVQYNTVLCAVRMGLKHDNDTSYIDRWIDNYIAKNSCFRERCSPFFNYMCS